MGWRGCLYNWLAQKFLRGSVLFSMRLAAFSRILLMSAVLLGFSQAAFAQGPYDIKKLTERVSADSGTTYLKLVRRIFPDTSVDESGESASATRSIKLRRLSGRGFSMHRAPLDIVRVRGWKFLAQGGVNHLALLIEVHKEAIEDGDLFDWQYALGVFSYQGRKGQTSSAWNLVEAVDPQEDRFMDLPDKLPLVDEGKGDQTFWTLDQHHNAGESFRDYKTIRVQSGRRLEWSIQGLPGLHDSNGCEAREETSLDVVPRPNPGQGYLPVEVRLKTLRWEKVDCQDEEGVDADSEETRTFLIRPVSHTERRERSRVEILEERKPIVLNSAGEVERFEGSLEIGKTYTAAFVFDERIGWRLATPIKIPFHHAVSVLWIDKKGILPSLMKENRYQIEFTVLGKNVRQAGNTRRWNTTYKCRLREAFILIPPKADGS